MYTWVTHIKWLLCNDSFGHVCFVVVVVCFVFVLLLLFCFGFAVDLAPYLVNHSYTVSVIVLVKSG